MKKLTKSSPQYKYWKLAEECGEVIQAISKIHRFGINNKRPGQSETNKTRLKAENNDLILALEEVAKLL